MKATKKAVGTLAQRTVNHELFSTRPANRDTIYPMYNTTSIKYTIYVVIIDNY